MTEKVRILVVEDDEDQLQAYHDAAEELNNEDLRIELTKLKSSLSAKEKLLSTNFDGAIVDLNLSTGNPKEASGNEVLLEITEKHRFPVLVVSGNLENIDPRIQESGFLKTFARDTANDRIFSFLLKIHATGITRILGGRGLIEQHLGEIFWKHLACDFDNWDAGDRNSEKTLLRYTVAHMSEYLDLPAGDTANECYHEAEFYIIPPIRKHIATGDIVCKKSDRFIVLSPACDVALRGNNGDKLIINAGAIVLAPIFALSREAFLRRGLLKEDDGSRRSSSILDQIIKGKIQKYILLPEYRNIDAGVVDLQNLHTWSLDEFLEADRLATVTGAFIKDIQSRFAAYYGRQGQPDLDKKCLLEKYRSKLMPQG